MVSGRSAKKTPKPLRNNAVVSLNDDIDVLAAYGLYNSACSHLCRLLEDVIVRIMDHLDWEDIFFLRHTSRVFMRLLVAARSSPRCGMTTPSATIPASMSCPHLGPRRRFLLVTITNGQTYDCAVAKRMKSVRATEPTGGFATTICSCTARRATLNTP